MITATFYVFDARTWNFVRTDFSALWASIFNPAWRSFCAVNCVRRTKKKNINKALSTFNCCSALQRFYSLHIFYLFLYIFLRPMAEPPPKLLAPLLARVRLKSYGGPINMVKVGWRSRALYKVPEGDGDETRFTSSATPYSDSLTFSLSLPLSHSVSLFYFTGLPGVVTAGGKLRNMWQHTKKKKVHMFQLHLWLLWEIRANEFWL